ncbi:hypothetical protein [Cystobacter ferrugineus]|uniref:Uncharacterized protein n=1 Tax=Cystobacter ferrugineus TaxID=83449 RepID=A0A1L9BH02_9BACT|nr:hypothetical protein [Cystobacter ferrugineus]OJH41543.1 hypothetical protein BON30_11885 [Cystobacter ferrugineus]
MSPAELKSWLACLHDAQLLALSVDYEREVLELRLNVQAGNPEAVSEEERESYLPRRMVVSGLQFCVVEPPGDLSLLKGFGPPLIDSAGEGVPPTSSWSFPVENSAAVMLWIYVSTWNSFIRFAGEDVEVH